MAGLKSTPFPGSPDAVILGAVSEEQKGRERMERWWGECQRALQQPLRAHRFFMSVCAPGTDGKNRILAFGTPGEEQYVFTISDPEARMLVRELAKTLSAEAADEAA